MADRLFSLTRYPINYEKQMSTSRIQFINFSSHEVASFQSGIASLEKSTPSKLEIDAYHDALLFPVHYFPGSTTLVSQCGAYNQDGRLNNKTVINRGSRQLRSIPQAIDIDSITVAKKIGIAIYGGFMTSHFGHALLETTARLWAINEQTETLDLVFCGSKQASPLARQLIELSASEGVPNILIPREPIRVETLLVPTPSLIIKKYIHEDHCKKLRENLKKKPLIEHNCPLLYLSRSRLEKDSRAIQNEYLIEDLVRSRNGAVCHPQDHGLREQLSIAIRSNVIITPIGSAAHIVLACNRPKTIVYLCRNEINLNYIMIDKLMGNQAIYIRCIDSPHEKRNEQATTELVCNLSLLSEVLNSLLS